MSGVLISAEVLVGALLLLGVFVAVTLLRRRLIAQDAELALCTLVVGTSRPRVGMMRMTVDTLEWYRLFGVTPRPDHRWARWGLDIGTPRPVDEDASPHGMTSSSVQVPVEVAGEPTPLAIVMTIGSYTAFRAWAEAGPPRFPVTG